MRLTLSVILFSLLRLAMCGAKKLSLASKTIAFVSFLKCETKNGTLRLGASLPKFKKLKSKNFSKAEKKSAMPNLLSVCSISSKLAFLSLQRKERSSSSISITLFLGLLRSFCILAWNRRSVVERLCSILFCSSSARVSVACIIKYS